jgi:tetratricopeptide (TPR) repeat protein
VIGDAYRQARHLAEAGRHADAEARLRAALATEPGDADLLTLLGFVLRQQREYVAALAACDAAAAARPGLAAAHAERAESLIALIRDKDAIAAAGAAVRLEPHRPGGHLVLARALASDRRFAEARTAARHGLSLAPQSVECLLTVADVERGAGNRGAAEEAARAALALDPSSAYGRWLLAMLDAERLRVGRSMRALHDVARENPARPDVISMTWPVRSLLSALRRWLAVAVVLVAVCALAAAWWSPAAPIGRILAGLFAAVVAGFAVRVLIPAGRMPWRCLRLVPLLLRRATRGGVVTVAVLVALLLGYAVTGRWWLPAAALVAVLVLWAFGLAELLGARLDDPGYRHALRDLGNGFRDWSAELGQWWRDTRRELGETWHEDRPPRQDAGARPEPPDGVPR